jgi:hypothetical protein
MFQSVTTKLSPGVRLRVKQELANSFLTEEEMIEQLIIEALRARKFRADFQADAQVALSPQHPIFAVRSASGGNSSIQR